MMYKIFLGGRGKRQKQHLCTFLWNNYKYAIMSVLMNLPSISSIERSLSNLIAGRPILVKLSTWFFINATKGDKMSSTCDVVGFTCGKNDYSYIVICSRYGGSNFIKFPNIST